MILGFRCKALLVIQVTVVAALYATEADSSHSAVTILAGGDVNLGRRVGRIIYGGDTEYPFVNVRSLFDQHDIVFVNLESQLSDREGETQHPKNNLIFCGPREGARALSGAGVDVVSTANNHAFDYGRNALRETLRYLEEESVVAVGTSADSVADFPPVVVERNGIRIAFVAYTQFMNFPAKWDGFVSLFDSIRALREIREASSQADVVIASYHGGDEYVDVPNERTQAQMEFLADAGASIVLGHHPHVPQGMVRRNGKFIVYSLGNFVFAQPQRYWTQRSFLLSFSVSKSDTVASISDLAIIPIKAGFQPGAMTDSLAVEELRLRLQSHSNVSFRIQEGRILVEYEN